MSRTRPAPPTKADLGTVLEQATRAVHSAALEYTDRHHAPDLTTMRDESWKLIHLLGSLSDLTAARAAQVGDYPQHHQLHSDDSVEPTRHVAHACRGWADLRHALNSAQHACREIYTALSHLSTQCLPDDGLSSGTGPIRRRW